MFDLPPWADCRRLAGLAFVALNRLALHPANAKQQYWARKPVPYLASLRSRGNAQVGNVWPNLGCSPIRPECPPCWGDPRRQALATANRATCPCARADALVPREATPDALDEFRSTLDLPRRRRRQRGPACTPMAKASRSRGRSPSDSRYEWPSARQLACRGACALVLLGVSRRGKPY